MDIQATPSAFAQAGLDDGENELEDMGFFSLTSSPQRSSQAQLALNELGLIPSPHQGLQQHNQTGYGTSRNALYIEDEDDDSEEANFDLDHELEMEEAQRREEAQQPTPYFLEEDESSISKKVGNAEEDEDDDVLESNGLLDVHSASNATPANDQDIPPSSICPTSPVARRQSRQAEASTSRHAEPYHEIPSPVPAPPRLHEKEDEYIGINGLPKYIPSGLSHIVLLDESTVCFERRRRVKAWRPKPVHYGSGPVGLLSRPVHKILDEVEAMRAMQLVRQDEEADAAYERRCRKSFDEKQNVSPAIWQERYRPGRFTELIGEERTHRDVLSWIKSWDKCVFGKRKGANHRKRTRDNDMASRAHANSATDGGAPAYSDKWDRPRERILLLGGPAGMGKTTLAHVAAKTSGYLVHEINASDDRSARTVEDRVRDALESNSLHAGKSRQPTCLILDEVDGATGGGGGGADAQGGQNAGGGFIRALIKLIEQGSRSTPTSSSMKKRNGGKRSRPLLRPIICVCNDPYAPSLRALRPYSKLVRLNRPSTPALMARLRQICEREKISHDSAGLNTLIGLCQGDVRSCLNALQLVQSDTRGITMAALRGGSDINGMSISSPLSIKDGNSNIHQVWQRLLRTHTSRERDRQRGAKGMSSSTSDGERSASSESHEVVASIISSGEMDKVLAGCFEHYPNLKLVDDGWWRFRRAHDWIHWYEHLNQRGWEIGMHTDLWAYLPWSFVCWRQLFANTTNELPEYPRVDYQNHLMRTAFDEMMHDVRTNLPVQTRCQFDKTAVTTELGPMLVPLMTPDLKPINAQLVRTEEKATLMACVNLMHSLNVDFALDKNAQGHTYYRFDPPLEAFAHFEGKRVEGHAGQAARFNVRQLISTELRALRVRNKQSVSAAATASSTGGGVGKGKRNKNGDEMDLEDDQAPQPKQQAPKAKGAVDFFGRPIALKPTAKANSAFVGMRNGSTARTTTAMNKLPDSILAQRQEKENMSRATTAPHVKSISSGVAATDVGTIDALHADNRQEQAADQDEEQCAAKRAKLKVFYNYHEGYSNAVRKPIKMSSLLS